MAKNTTPSRPTPPKAPAPVREPDYSLLDDKTVADLRAKAEAKVLARRKVEAEEAFLATEMEKIERDLYPAEVQEMRDIVLDLALYADRVTLDGRVFYHGVHYTVPKPVYDVLKECEANSRRHDEEIHGDPDSNFYRQDRNRYKVSARTGAPAPGSAIPRF